MINQFISKRTNHRNDQWGGSYENRTRLAREVVKNVRQAVGKDFIIIYRLSMLDLVEDGSTWPEIVEVIFDQYRHLLMCLIVGPTNREFWCHYHQYRYWLA